MTKLEHVGWYLAVIANVYAAAGTGGFAVWGFVALAAITMVVAYIDEKRSIK